MLAIQDVGYIAAGWGLSLVAIGGYALRVVLRGRRLAERVPPEERRWT